MLVSLLWKVNWRVQPYELPYHGAAGIEDSMHMDWGHYSPRYLPKSSESISKSFFLSLCWDVDFSATYFHLLITPSLVFSSTVLDLFLNVFAIFLNIWDRPEINIWASFSLHYLCTSDLQHLYIFTPHLS